ncbi:hypothetical protein BH24DEI1_BH24DEI1_12490 [soil metagenome]|jgi:hypothetical protein
MRAGTDGRRTYLNAYRSAVWWSGSRPVVFFALVREMDLPGYVLPKGGLEAGAMLAFQQSPLLFRPLALADVHKGGDRPPHPGEGER